MQALHIAEHLLHTYAILPVQMSLLTKGPVKQEISVMPWVSTHSGPQGIVFNSISLLF